MARTQPVAKAAQAPVSGEVKVYCRFRPLIEREKALAYE